MKIFLMASKDDCPFCRSMYPIFQSIVKEFQGTQDLRFGMYDVKTDKWQLAEQLGFDGVPGFALISDTEPIEIFAINNDGIVSREILVGMLINNLEKKSAANGEIPDHQKNFA